MTSGLYAPNRHGDQDNAAGMLDFAVNVRGSTPAFVVAAIAATVSDLARYPSNASVAQVASEIAQLHRRHRDEVMLLAGAADGFELLPRLGATHAALIQPSFTEPEIVLRAAGIPITQVIVDPSQPLDAATVARIPEAADLVVIGNPTNPTSVLHSAAAIRSMHRPGRTIVVDEAFADVTVDHRTGVREPESLAGLSLPDVIVIRSVTKTFGLAGLRAGYLLAAPEIIERLERGRRAWPLATPALAALRACCGPQGQRYCEEQAGRVHAERDHLVTRLSEIGIVPAAPPAAPFVLIALPDGLAIKELLRAKGIAVRSCVNFVGLDRRYLRLAVRPAPQVDALIAALDRVRDAEPMANVNGEERRGRH